MNSERVFSQPAKNKNANGTIEDLVMVGLLDLVDGGSLATAVLRDLEIERLVQEMELERKHDPCCNDGLESGKCETGVLEFSGESKTILNETNETIRSLERLPPWRWRPDRMQVRDNYENHPHILCCDGPA